MSWHDMGKLFVPKNLYNNLTCRERKSLAMLIFVVNLKCKCRLKSYLPHSVAGDVFDMWHFGGLKITLLKTLLGYLNGVNGKVHPRTGREGPDGQKRYSSSLSLTSALDEGGWLRHAPAALPPG
jgi:hypothetical protein